MSRPVYSLMFFSDEDYSDSPPSHDSEEGLLGDEIFGPTTCQETYYTSKAADWSMEIDDLLDMTIVNDENIDLASNWSIDIEDDLFSDTFGSTSCDLRQKLLFYACFRSSWAHAVPLEPLTASNNLVARC